ncbi:MAG: diguanylate cyclase, partial [Candidatus Izemoplasmatales bacterium]
MTSLIFLTDPNTANRPWEVAVAALLVISTAVALFFLYRNVIFHFKQNKLERDSLTKDKLNDDSMLDKLTSSVSVNHLLAQINEDINSIDEGDLRLFFAMNLDNFRYIVDSYSQKDVDKIIAEYSKRLKKYAAKGSIAGHYEKDIFIYYYKGVLDNDKINLIAQELLDLFKQPTKL